MTDPERITCNCGDDGNPHLCGKVHPQADATERQCLWLLCWLVVVGTFAAAGLVTLGGCR